MSTALLSKSGRTIAPVSWTTSTGGSDSSAPTTAWTVRDHGRPMTSRAVTTSWSRWADRSRSSVPWRTISMRTRPISRAASSIRATLNRLIPSSSAISTFDRWCR